MQTLWLVGLAVAVISTVALKASAIWQEWANFALGVWLVLSPWLLDFAASASILLVWDSVIFGALIFVVAGWALTEEPRRRRSAT